MKVTNERMFERKLKEIKFRKCLLSFDAEFFILLLERVKTDTYFKEVLFLMFCMGMKHGLYS
jgi:hypothetical protein